MALTKITTDIIADGAITSAHLASGAVTHSSLSSITTDNVSEGSTNLYFTNARVDTEIDSYLSGGTGVTISSGAISIGQAVATNSNVTFADLTLTGNLNITGDINSYNVTDLDVTDQTITLGAGQTEALSGGSGIIVDGSGASILWDETNDVFDINKGLTALGNVGIGTDAPSYKLSLQDNSTSAYPLVLENGNIGTPGVHTGIRFGYSGNTYQKGAIIFEGQDAAARGKMYFAMEGTADNSNADETDAKMTIDYSGNVGIGETVPVAKLHIQGSGTTGQVTSSFLLENSSSGTAGLDITGAAGSSRLRFLYGGGPSTGTNTLTEALNIVLEGSNAGNVGIGESTPVTPFHVKMGTGKNILFQDALSSAAIKFTTDAGASYAYGTINASSLAINADSGGNVGIGTSSFGATYDKLAVAGGINIQDDNNGKLEIGRYSSGASNSYIKLGANSNSLKITNNTDGADIVTILNNSHTGIGSSAISPAGVLHIDDGSNNVDLRITSDLGGGNPATLRLLAYGVGGDNWIQSGTANSGATRAPLKFSGSDGNYICAVMNQTLGVTEGSFFRANNWHGASVNTIGGPAMEIGYAGSSGYVHGYNRNASSYIPVSYDGIEHRWYVSGTGPKAVLNSNGQFLVNFSNPASTSNFLLGVDGSIGLGGDDVVAAGAGYGPSNSSAGYGSIKFYNSANGNMEFNQTYSHARYYFYHGTNNEVFRIEDGGHSGIYGYSFHYTTTYGSVGVGALNGGYHHTMTQSGPSTFYWNNRCEASGGFHTYSDERLKENVTTISGALDKVALMNGVTFNWIDAENRGGGDTGKQFGVIAQNMLEVDPELPSLNPDPLATQEEIDNEELETDYYTMDYSRITPFLIEAIKELKTKLEAAEARIETLENP